MQGTVKVKYIFCYNSHEVFLLHLFGMQYFCKYARLYCVPVLELGKVILCSLAGITKYMYAYRECSGAHLYQPFYVVLACAHFVSIGYQPGIMPAARTAFCSVVCLKQQTRSLLCDCATAYF